MNYYNDLFSFDTETLTWAKLEAKGKTPAPRAAHTSFLVGNKWYIFGGRYVYATWTPPNFDI